MRPTSRAAAVLVLGALAWLGPVAPAETPQADPPRPAVRLDAVPAIVSAFRTHALVAFPGPFDPLLPALFADPEFAATVDDLVVEFGNARSQAVMDRFQRGDAVPDAELRRVWLDGIDPEALWESARDEAFVRMVREVNQTRVPVRRLRVLLGGPPIDWRTLRTTTDYQAWHDRQDSFAADLIQREVLAKRRHALLLFSPLHYQRHNAGYRYVSDGPGATLVSRIEHAAGVPLFTIWPTDRLLALQRSTLFWNSGIALLRGTVLGAADFNFYLAPDRDVYVDRNGRIEVTPPPHGPEWRPLRMEDQFDAVLMREDDLAVPSPPAGVLCADAGYIKAVLARMALAGLPPAESKRVTDFCSPLQVALQAIDPGLRESSVLGAVPLTFGAELQLVLGTPRAAAVGEHGFSWTMQDVLALVTRGPGAAPARVVTSVRHQEDDCCGSTILTLTPAEIAVSREAEKGDKRPTLKFYVDGATGVVTRADVLPFSLLRVRGGSAAPEFDFEDGARIVHVRPSATAPFLELAGDAQPLTDRDRIAAWPDASPAIPGFTLPQSPVPAGGADVHEAVGPTAREGSRVWFGKTFDMDAGIGGFGYFDMLTATSELFAPPEMHDSAVSAIRVEPEALWLGLIYHGDWGDFGNGLLRVRRPGLQVDVFPVPAVIREIARVGGRLYLATRDGVSILSPGGGLEHWFVDVDREGRLQLTRAWNGVIRR